MIRVSPRDWLPSGRALAVVPPFAWLVLFLVIICFALINYLASYIPR